jgi:hypothetical protein
VSRVEDLVVCVEILTADPIAVIQRALSHPQSQSMSNREIARHLGMPEATFRRTYEMDVAHVGTRESLTEIGTMEQLRAIWRCPSPKLRLL